MSVKAEGLTESWSGGDHPAFPTTVGCEDGKEVVFKGASIRDFFAAFIMAGTMAGPRRHCDAKWVFDRADEMVAEKLRREEAEREKKTDNRRENRDDDRAAPRDPEETQEEES